jgi:hypothetical protein
MKKAFSILLVFTVILMFSGLTFAGGFEDNRNETARLYNGFYSENIYLVMKWSKDWEPMAHQAPGAWLTNHFVWYTNDYEDESTYYGYDSALPYGTGSYRIEEFIKMKAIADEDAAQYGDNVIWGNIIILKDTLTIIDNTTGEVIDVLEILTPLHPGFGNLKF